MWPGSPFPLGASWDGQGTNFSLFSEHAGRVELCLFDDEGRETRHELPRRTAFNWHGYLPGVGPGARYGYRVHGPYDAGERGTASTRRSSSSTRTPRRSRAGSTGTRRACSRSRPAGRTATCRTPRTTQPRFRRPIVIDDAFDWEGDQLLRTPWNETIIYEAHVKGFTKRHPGVREELRGTYAGLASDEAIAYLQLLGVTAVELLPVHHIVDEPFLHDRGLTNYWGYSSIGYFAPHAAYAATGSRASRCASSRGWSRRCIGPGSR